PFARYVRGDERGTLSVTQIVDRADCRKCRVLKPAETFHSFAQRGNEAVREHQLRPETQQLPGWRSRVVEHQQPVAEGVRGPLGIPAGEGWLLFGLGGVDKLLNDCHEPEIGASSR